MKLPQLTLEVDLGPLEDLLEDINAMQTYKLFENDDMILVDKADLCDILVRHVRARRSDEQPVKRGRWDRVRVDNIGVCSNIVCSECFFEPWYNSVEPLYNFCPNCGARMEGET